MADALLPASAAAAGSSVVPPPRLVQTIDTARQNVHIDRFGLVTITPAGERVLPAAPSRLQADVGRADSARVCSVSKQSVRSARSKRTRSAWSCPACSSTFRSKNALRQHTAAKHAASPSSLASKPHDTPVPPVVPPQGDVWIEAPTKHDAGRASLRHSPPSAARPRYTPPRSPSWEEMHPVVADTAAPIALLLPRRQPPLRPAQQQQHATPLAGAIVATPPERAMTLREARRSLEHHPR